MKMSKSILVLIVVIIPSRRRDRVELKRVAHHVLACF